MKTPRIHKPDESFEKNVFIENQRPVRARFLEAGLDVNSRKEDRSEVHPSTNAARRSACAPLTKVRTILLPLDLTESSGDAFDYAISLAKAWHASIVLLHVVDVMYPGAFLDTAWKRSFKTKVHRQAREKLDAFAKGASNRFVPIRSVVRHGVPDYEILRLAENLDADMIVLGRRRRGSLSRLVFGSVTHDVIDAAPCPVLVVPASRSVHP